MQFSLKMLLVLMVMFLLCSATSHGAHVAASDFPVDRIKHVVVLMLENRAFDHFFGKFPGVNGLSGFEFNLLNVSNSASERIYVSSDAPYANQCDPDHSLPATTYKIFGPAQAQTGNLTTPSMSAFVQQEWLQDGFNSSVNFCNVMQGFAPDRLPVISALASEFAIMDHFFASVPGPTWPNRAFMLAATSSGLTETGVWYQNSTDLLLPSKTIYDQVSEAGGKWRHYYNDTPWELFLESVAFNPDHVRPVTELWDDAASGNLPDFAFINPRCGMNTTTGLGSNDDHPDHDVALGEQFIKDVYEALRASPQWNETLFVLTFDEHGGFYDHVSPPMDNIPPPDHLASYPDIGFPFDRLGMRIPTILVSPWVAKGSVISAPPAAQKPTPSSQYDLTSIMSTSRKLLSVLNSTGPLTKRDAWAATFEHALMTLDAPRTDCPTWLPSAPPPSRSTSAEGNLPVNGLQRDILSAHAHRLGVQHPHHIVYQGDVGEWLQTAYQQHRTSVYRRRVLDVAASMSVAMITVLEPHVSVLWKMSNLLDGLVQMFSTQINNTELCLSSGGIVSFSEVVAVPCSMVDLSQQWSVDAATTSVRPFLNASLCLTSYLLQGARHLYVTPCNDPQISLDSQSWGYGGLAAGAATADVMPGHLLFNNGPFVVALVRRGG
ncbi:phospholipase C 3-like, putative [Bodo saltans]|uniref:Phospholipase C 3-like, putative n=1 Tax=Bodo saltans TaxID=75058 RepID=A0A0S4INI2_BODSA|nr:phospholipase C 3-like, putative [Bodo saltans]|eukprot:CUF66623.1 phospholipase C 3-like, putative [Bodo saltans]